MQIYRYLLLSLFVLALSSSAIHAQKLEKLKFFEPADTFNAPRFWASFGIGAATYTGAMIGLSQIWYADFPRGKFKLFNDWDEWEKMDKIGHAFTAYQETRATSELLGWAGLKRRRAMWYSIGLATLFQTSLEMFDGFSEEWGFSLHDVAFNTLGSGVFAAQEFIWQEQRMTLKVSSSGVSYPSYLVSSVDGQSQYNLQDRAVDLYGTFFMERFFKDYNGQTLWLSANVYDFLHPTSRFPKWLNVAVGYGAGNIYGGTANAWTIEDTDYILSETIFPRYQQFYLSLDVDLRKIKTKNHFLRTVLRTLSFFKIPAPALEFNTLGKAKFHPLHY